MLSDLLRWPGCVMLSAVEALPSAAFELFTDVWSLAPASPPLRMTGLWRLLADSRQLFPTEHIHYPIAPDAALQDHSATRALFYFSDAHGALRNFYLS
jgi:hypothetical protein